MISNNFVHVLFLVMMWLSLASSIVFYVFLSKSKYNKNKLVKNFYFKDKKYLISLGLLFLAFISFFLEFYSDPTVYYYLHSIANIEIDALHYVLIIVGSLLSSFSIFIFISKFVEYFYSNDKDKKTKKDLVLLLVFLVALIISIIVFLEGNAPYLRYPLPNRIYIGADGIKLITTDTGYDWASATDNGIQIALYAICILFGACLVLSFDSYLVKKLYGNDTSLTTLFLVAFPAGIIGARAWYVVGNWERDGFNTNFAKIFQINKGGLTIIGGTVFGAAIGILFMLIMQYIIKNKTYKKINLLMLIDIACASILLAQALGRFGNFFNNEVHGNLVDESNYLWIPSIIRNNMKFSSAHRIGSDVEYLEKLNGTQIYQPLFLIEGIFNVIGFIVLEFIFRIVLRNIGNKENKLFGNYLCRYVFSNGSNLGYYLVWYGLTRFFLEPLRDSAFNMGNDDAFSIKGSFGMVIIGVVIVILFGVYQLLKDKKIIKIELKEE